MTLDPQTPVTLRPEDDLRATLNRVGTFYQGLGLLTGLRRWIGVGNTEPSMIQMAVTEAEFRGYVAGLEYALGLQGGPVVPEMAEYLAQVAEIAARYDSPLADEDEDEEEDGPFEHCAECEQAAECWPSTAVVN